MDHLRWIMTAPAVLLSAVEADYLRAHPHANPGGRGHSLRLYQHWVRHRERIEREVARRG